MMPWMSPGLINRVKHIGQSVATLRDLAERTNQTYNSDPTRVYNLCENPAVFFFHMDDKKAFEYPHVREQANEDLAEYTAPVNG